MKRPAAMMNELQVFETHLKKKCSCTMTCTCNPLYQKHLSLRFKRTNSSAAEQVFSWFRGYARVLDGCTPSRHAFKVLYFADFIVKLWRLFHSFPMLASFVKRGKKSSGPYSCSLWQEAGKQGLELAQLQALGR